MPVCGLDDVAHERRRQRVLKIMVYEELNRVHTGARELGDHRLDLGSIGDFIDRTTNGAGTASQRSGPIDRPKPRARHEKPRRPNRAGLNTGSQLDDIFGDVGRGLNGRHTGLEELPELFHYPRCNRRLAPRVYDMHMGVYQTGDDGPSTRVKFHAPLVSGRLVSNL